MQPAEYLRVHNMLIAIKSSANVAVQACLHLSVIVLLLLLLSLFLYLLLLLLLFIEANIKL